VRRGRKHAVVAATARMIRIDGTTQRPRPEARGRVDIVGPAIDEQTIDARAMHLRISPSVIVGYSMVASQFSGVNARTNAQSAIWPSHRSLGRAQAFITTAFL